MMPVKFLDPSLVRNPEETIKKYVHVTPALCTRLQEAFKECLYLDPSYEGLNHNDAFELLRHRMGLVNHKTLIENLFFDSPSRQRVKEMDVSTLNKIANFLSKNKNFLLEATTLINEIRRLKVNKVELIPELRKEIRNISKMCKDYAMGYTMYDISTKMGFSRFKFTSICWKSYNIKNLEEEEIEAIREFVSTNFPDAIHEFPILFDITLLEGGLNGGPKVDNNRAPRPIPPIEKNPASFSRLTKRTCHDAFTEPPNEEKSEEEDVASKIDKSVIGQQPVEQHIETPQHQDSIRTVTWRLGSKVVIWRLANPIPIK